MLVWNVPAHQKHIVATLTRLFKETSDTLGPAKKRDIEGISRKVGSLFAKLNNEDISKHAAEKLSLLCQALDKHDFVAALQIQVKILLCFVVFHFKYSINVEETQLCLLFCGKQAHLASTEWDECNFWLLPLKQMIKGRQNVR